MKVCTTSGETPSNKNSNNNKLKKALVTSCACICAVFFVRCTKNEENVLQSSLKFLNENELWVVFLLFFESLSPFFLCQKKKQQVRDKGRFKRESSSACTCCSRKKISSQFSQMNEYVHKIKF